MPDWLRDPLRAARGYELVPLDRLATEERADLAQAAGEADLYGLLRPKPGSRLPPRAATCDVALLLLTLREPAPLPAYVGRASTGEPARTAARLVYDGVLEVLSEGRWISGPGAATHTAGSDADSRIPALSLAALQYAQALEGVPAPLLGMRLYDYGRRPVTPALRRTLPDERHVAAWAGLQDLDLGTRWREGTRSPHWRSWSAASADHGARPRATWKLYVSPTAEALGDGVRAVAAAAEGVRGAQGMKCAYLLRGVVRPDKLVAYCTSLEALLELATRVRSRLDGVPAHGVPFTAPIGTDGLLSWGVDPPNGAPGVAQSWRQWITERLAEHIVEGRDAATEPWRYAMTRVALDGVDTDTWAPEDGLFTSPPVAA